uniref:NADH-ubiquinone oxidoreductase chain 6 n=1 Tax=Pyrophorus divergens TaxID=423334 RepID=A8QZJ7_9COLE|nr:NADH dehydrogenase subunit 6 [Pyrophorus divergens]ABN11501.1 NADH dehydrogenase subunit 6 [Pyrophorus divergens]
MISILYTISLSMTMTFMFIEHPLSMGLILLMQTTLIAILTGLMAQNFWFSYILFMIMIGGMLVLFIYMTSVASNEKFLFSTSILALVCIMITVTFITQMMDQFSSYQNSTNTEMVQMIQTTMYTLAMSKYLNFPLNSWMITLIIYLLMALIAVVKITNITYGPLRQKM